MTVIVMECAPESVRGELTRWFLELKPGVFVGNVNVRIRELLWKRICETDAATGSVMVFSASNEQGFEMKVFGDPKRKVIDFEGIQLITVTETSDDATEGATLL
ncbi:type I-E CRISPR-associated endoribonuclease Cas2e [Butyricicoccus pullicaecorum]|uniref:Type I-E CRISPR-associated endoribonuclease Cas2 n=1 Tax=Butyricicoccus pullicaecorum TaxID=501571 RepID=A0A1Y4LU90_9FIRM|nr:type I-E CRISPR-associated endoribonuclease Cas2e [Butyricicoccus pullicaecorum]OUP59420.1 type I-E CRISPR-associated endoribonuclease Cas2 [Butyricicoccus pullicaecorum]